MGRQGPPWRSRGEDSTAMGAGSNPGWGTNILHAVWAQAASNTTSSGGMCVSVLKGGARVQPVCYSDLPALYSLPENDSLRVPR